MRFPLSKGQKVLMLLLAIFPIICVGVYFFMFFGLFIKGPEHLLGHHDQGILPPFMWRLMIPMLLALISQLLMFILYLLHALKNPRLKEGNDRLVWILVLLFANFIGGIIYWRMQIWDDKEKRFQDVYDN